MSEPTGAGHSQAGDDLLTALADDFLRRRRAGERPSPEEYASKHPELAGRIRALFPTMIALEQPGLDPAPPAERVGSVIGRYKLLERLGEGGFGVVFMAEQQHPVRRTVALKVIKPGFDSGQIIARFEAERQALALMDHENIARVLDAGATDSGRPYFVMELVHGVPITEYCDKRQLAPRQRLELFAQVCRAVQHAHTKGIIHRDLKPTNVLVTLREGVAVPKVIDFGVAKATGQQLTDKTLFTNFAQMVGTPLYMSPEQAEMTGIDVDTRSDVYSLGVLLYELLTGTTPVDKQRLKQAAFDEVRRIIREEDPPKPSTRLSESRDLLASISAQRQTEPAKLTRLMRGELDWIVMKALEKDRRRRYETANGFALDVQRYLADEPVQACPPSAGYRLRKFVRRHRVPVIAAGVVLLCLVAGIVGTSAALVWAVRERDDKSRALAAETTARAAEKQARDRALVALRDVTDDIVESQMARGAQLTEENKEFLRKVINHFEGFAAITADDADSRAIRAEGYYRIGRMRYRLSELREAEAAYAPALALQKQLVAEFPARPEFRRALAATHNNMGNLLNITGRAAEAEAAYADALTLLKQLAADFPGRPDFRQELASSQGNLGALLRETGRLKPAETALDEALVLQKQLVAEFPTRPELRQVLARIHNIKGELLRRTGRLQEAEAALAATHALRKQLAADFPTRPDFQEDLAGSHNNLGVFFSDTGRPTSAEAAYAAALALYKQLAADFPTRPEFRQELAKTQNNLGNLLSDTGRPQEAESTFLAALTLQKQLAGDFPTRTEFRSLLAATHNNLGILYMETDRPLDAERAYAAAIALYQALSSEVPTRPEFRQELATTHNNLGVLFRKMRQLERAEASYSAALEVQKQLAADFPARPELRQDLAKTHNNLGTLYLKTGRVELAETAHAAALALRRQLAADFPTRTEFRQNLATSHFNLGVLLGETGRPREAEAAYADALTLQKQLAADFPNQPDLQNAVARTYTNLSYLRVALRDFRGAKAYLADAAPHYDRALKANSRNPTYRQNYERYQSAMVQAHGGSGDWASAKRAAEQLRDLGWDPPGDAFNAACSLSLCIPIVQEVDGATKDERDKQAAFYGDEAMKMLRDAIAKGHPEPVALMKDSDLDPLRGREDFKQLQAQIEAKPSEQQIKKPEPENRP